MNKVLCLTALLALVSGVVLADGPETGVVTGTVTDATKSPIPGVNVTLTGGGRIASENLGLTPEMHGIV